jgi:type II secretory pathway component PulF
MAVLIATLVALILILTLVVPEFKPIFAGSEDKLPQLTRAVLSLSDNASEWGLIILIASLLISLCTWLFLKSEAGGQMRENNPLFFPGQKLRDQYLAARFSGLFSTLLLNDVNVVRAFSLASDALPSLRWRNHMGNALERVREGERLSDALAKASAFPDTARRLIEVGERSGRLGETCREASKIMNDISSQRIQAIVSLVNPLAIILLGGIVALLVAGVMLGIFSLGDFAG